MEAYNFAGKPWWTYSSARLLMYHFGSKENLLANALELVRQRADTSLRSLAAEEDPRSLEEFLLMLWTWAMYEPSGICGCCLKLTDSQCKIAIGFRSISGNLNSSGGATF